MLKGMLSERAYQTKMIDFGMNRLYAQNELGAGFLADPGVGKTRVALTIADMMLSFGETRRVLIAGPIRVLDLVWPLQLAEWGFDRSMVRIDDNPPRAMGANAQIELVSRDSLHKLAPFAGRWDLLIVDESHGFKTWKTKRMKSIRKLLPQTPKRIIMTGTPTPNTLADLHSQAFILDDGAALGKNVSAFRYKYMTRGGWQGRQWIMREDKKDELLAAVAHMMIRIDAESNLDMPDLLINDVWCQLPDTAQRIHAQMKRELAAELANQEEVFAANAAAAYNKLRQISNGNIYNAERRVEHVHSAKLQALIDLIDELQGKQVLVFYQFKHDADMILSALTDVVNIDGSLSPQEAASNIQGWLAGKFQVLLIQNQAGAEGLNLQTGGCADVVFFGLPDIPNLYDQGYRRLYRQGGARSIRVHRLLCVGTVEVTQSQRLDGKIKTQAEFLQALKDFANG